MVAWPARVNRWLPVGRAESIGRVCAKWGGWPSRPDRAKTMVIPVTVFPGYGRRARGPGVGSIEHHLGVGGNTPHFLDLTSDPCGEFLGGCTRGGPALTRQGPAPGRG